MDHDRLFKQLLTTFFAEFIELFLPDVAAELDRASIHFLEKEILTDLGVGDRIGENFTDAKSGRQRADGENEICPCRSTACQSAMRADDCNASAGSR